MKKYLFLFVMGLPLCSFSQIFKPQGTSITDSWNTYSTGIGTQQPYWNAKLDIVGDNAGNKYASQLHLHTTGNPWGMFLGSYGNSIGVLSVGSHYSGGGNHQAKAPTSAGVIFYEGKTHFFANTGLTADTDFAPAYTLTIAANGNVGVGTSVPDTKLAVKGIIHAQEVRVDLNVPGPDYVFEPDYSLMPLTVLENYLKANKHLPEVPSAKTMEQDGVKLMEMNMILLKKVEELTLYIIELEKENKRQNDAINKLVDDSGK
ncbi:hypothetical protein KK062_22285 [Fulvivirgaceae bacterium PWU5]|uniref:Uncharacterized protein n=1 Tax=Dawidia cretensis TaxID=2782350 RepID=A0AAP2E2T2_9BACT|nr:hypothetical protein [Dawidia cretensis]MBT1710988.1 hypothetical protein [Dawidia cretensis]